MKVSHEIRSLAALRERKIVLAERMQQSGQRIDGAARLFAHPIEWAADAFVRNANFSASSLLTTDNILRMLRFSHRCYRLWRLARTVLKMIRKS